MGHTSGAQELPVVSGSWIGQDRYRPFPLLQKVLLGAAVLEVSIGSSCFIMSF